MKSTKKKKYPSAQSNFEELYLLYNKREFVHPDPLEFLYSYNDLKEREVVGILASSLAYGRVAQILKSVAAAIARMEGEPYKFVISSSKAKIEKSFKGFKHRFTTDKDMVSLLIGMKQVFEKYGSLNDSFVAGLKEEDETLLPALSAFTLKLSGGKKNTLLPQPHMGSACKRLNLFLRWMVRSDDVDPGGWSGIPNAKLIVPLDTHMHKIGLALGLTERKAADMRTALEITAAFARVSPQDPVRYDFSLTRLGIRNDLNKQIFLDKFCKESLAKFKWIR